MDRILNSSLNGSESNKDFAIGKLTNGFWKKKSFLKIGIFFWQSQNHLWTQQNTDLKNLVQTLKARIDELVIRKDMSCFMCREELRGVKRDCQTNLDTAKTEYHEKLEDLGEILTKRNENSKSGKYAEEFILQTQLKIPKIQCFYS